MPTPPLILVLGMHRSGTSLLGNVLHAAGVALPGDLITADQHNPEGYFERADITELQEQLLIDLERWWPSAEGILPLPHDWLCRPCTHVALNALRRILEREAPQQTTPWAIKDPRTSLLLPLWRRVAGELQLPLRLVLAVRQPAEVVQSLCKRDGEAAGMTAPRGERLWWRHNQAVLHHAAGLPLLVVDFDRWFSPGDAPSRQLQELLWFCGRAADQLPADQLSHALAQIKSEHRRSDNAAEAVALDPSSLSLYQDVISGELERVQRAEPPYRAASGATSVPPHAVDAWFDADFYRRLHPDLADLADPLAHYCSYGWLEGRQPHPLFNPTHYLKACVERGLVLPAGQSPLEHFLCWGLTAGLTPTPLLQHAWWTWRQAQFVAERPPCLSDLHPWGGAALALADHNLTAATSLLSCWIERGIPSADWPSIRQAQGPWLRWPGTLQITALRNSADPLLPCVSSGVPLDYWLGQGWLAALPQPMQRWEGFHLMLLPVGQQPSQDAINALSTSPALCIADPDPDRCSLWTHLGLTSFHLQHPSQQQLDLFFSAQPWLERAQSQLGLPAPAALASRSILTLGSAGTLWSATNDLHDLGSSPASDDLIAPDRHHPDRWCFPSFETLCHSGGDHPRLLAAWLWHCHRQGIHLVRFSHDLHEQIALAPFSWLPIHWINTAGLSSSGLPLTHWLAQGWLSTLPSLGFPKLGQRLHLMLLPHGQQPSQDEINALSTSPALCIADPDPDRCSLWTHLGLTSFHLQHPSQQQLDLFFSAQPWLERAQSQLGLPAPAALASRSILTLGSAGTLWDAQTDQPDQWCLPGFDDLVLHSIDEARSVAAWLWQCHMAGLQIVRLTADADEQIQLQPLSWIPMEWMCSDSLTNEALRWELQWRQADQPEPQLPTTPQPDYVVLWDGGHLQGEAQLAVVVSLFNYANRVLAALQSVADQDLELIELIIVDDASNDAGASVVETWLQANSERFSRARLLQHTSNAGLAAARNTAFQATTAPWCLVLDADNQLLPRAASSLLTIAEQGDAYLAVVHPLIEEQVEDSDGTIRTVGLLSHQIWQRALFASRAEGNYIDAMALVRRTAWDAVGGYTHIPGGWEDFDFWCLLIEAGFYGVICPSVLARYRRHAVSMLRQKTNSNVRRISRVLQHRHPWLHLRLAQQNF